MIAGPLLLIVLLINAGYCIRKILEDWEGGARGMVALGLFCLVAVNGFIVWLFYDALASSTDL